MLALVIVLILSLLGLLGLITHHGESRVVPSVVGTDAHAAIKKLEAMGFEVNIIDSTYSDTAAFGRIMKQFPEPNSSVKINRTILLSINRYTLPLIDMPALEGKSIQFAIELLRRYHLKLGDTITQPDFMQGSVLEQRVRGDKILAGAKIPWGSRIDLVIGSGLGNMEMDVPDFIGYNFATVKDSMTKMGILLGAIVCDPDVIDTLSSYVWRQTPPSLNENNESVRIKSGQLMDIWLSTTPKSDTAKYY
jgi:beta-lactam-binding protein with PASTA domain